MPKRMEWVFCEAELELRTEYVALEELEATAEELDEIEAGRTADDINEEFSLLSEPVLEC
jgi:hypothetical protein